LDEFVGESEAGLLFEVGDVSGMIDGCCQILENTKLASKMGKNGRERVLKDYSEDIVISYYENLYQRVI